MSELNKYFFEIHSDIPREGPGSDQSTLQALKAVPNLPSKPQIADIGCGPGKASLLLAKETGGNITALDIHQPFLDQLIHDAKIQNVLDKIHVVRADMQAPPFQKEEFDLIWAEGAIYFLGFENGLHAWRPFLKNGGYIAVSHLSWLTKNPSKIAFDFWTDAYPAIVHIGDNLKILADTGFKLINYFAIPASDWWDEYYAPMEKRIHDLQIKYPANAEAQEAVSSSQHQIEVWKKHGADYGYVFYIAQKI